MSQFNQQQRASPGAGSSSIGVGTSSSFGATPMHVLLAGTSVLNSQAFLTDLSGSKGAPTPKRQAPEAQAGSSTGFPDPRALLQSIAPIASSLTTATSTTKTL